MTSPQINQGGRLFYVDPAECIQHQGICLKCQYFSGILYVVLKYYLKALPVWNKISRKFAGVNVTYE